MQKLVVLQTLQITEIPLAQLAAQDDFTAYFLCDIFRGFMCPFQIAAVDKIEWWLLLQAQRQQFCLASPGLIQSAIALSLQNILRIGMTLTMSDKYKFSGDRHLMVFQKPLFGSGLRLLFG